MNGVKRNDDKFMRYALTLAKRMSDNVDSNLTPEVPVAAIVVHNNEIIAEGRNRTISDCDPSAHAEIIAIRNACNQIANHRLLDCTLYVTLEPCIMCAGAILQARISRLVYAASDKRFGAAGSLINVLESPLLNHQCTVVKGIGESQSSQLLQDFFKQRR